MNNLFKGRDLALSTDIVGDSPQPGIVFNDHVVVFFRVFEPLAEDRVLLPKLLIHVLWLILFVPVTDWAVFLAFLHHTAVDKVAGFLFGSGLRNRVEISTWLHELSQHVNLLPFFNFAEVQIELPEELRIHQLGLLKA